MDPACMLLPVLWSLTVAGNKPGRKSRGFWTADGFEDSVDDDRVDNNSCLLLLCKLSIMCYPAWR